MKNIEYKIIKERYIHDLTERVNEAIADGWEPLSGFSTVKYIDSVVEYIQSMVRTKDKE